MNHAESCECCIPADAYGWLGERIPFVSRDLALYAAEVDPARFRQWLVRQWTRGVKRPRDGWCIAVACDTRTREVVYSLPDVMRAAAATRRSPMRRGA